MGDHQPPRNRCTFPCHRSNKDRNKDKRAELSFTGKVLDRWSFALRKPRFVRKCRAIDHQVYHNKIATKWT